MNLVTESSEGARTLRLVCLPGAGRFGLLQVPLLFTLLVLMGADDCLIGLE